MVVLTDSSNLNNTVEDEATMDKKNRKRKAKGGGVKTTVTASPTKKNLQGQGQNQLLDGMSAAEVTMIRRLAGNDPAVRKKTMRKLRKWLSAIVQRFPDDVGARPNIEPNIIRVWKALFYCMWMADKPLPQEHLAEQISNLVQIFSAKPSVYLLFVEWFFRTISREWNWIDRLRLDKFMMLFRRFLRRSLAVLAERKWKADILDGFMKIIRVHIFNHHPNLENKFKNGTPCSLEPPKACPMGLQIHFVDVFLEELAKVDAEGLKSPKILKMISPFIEEMASNTDDRLLDKINERIFHHLMRQSDVGIDYQEGLIGVEDDDQIEFDGENDNNDQDQDPDEENESGDDEQINIENETDKQEMDPRAGGVDVVLPQLQIDYSALAEKLTEAGGNKGVTKRNRGKLYSLASQFRDLVKGVYPLALPEIESWKPPIPKKELKKATERLMVLENTGDAKRRKTKKQRKRDAKRQRQQAEQLDDTAGSEDASAFLHDEELLDHVSDNYASYVHEQMDDVTSTTQEEPESHESTPTPKKKSKKSKSEGKEKKKKYKTIVEFESIEGDGDDITEKIPTKRKVASIDSCDTVVDIPLPKKKKSKLSLSNNSNFIDSSSEPSQKKKRKCKSLSPNSAVTNDLNDKPFQLLSMQSSIVTPVAKLKQKLRLAPTPPGQNIPSSQKKKVNFVLARNSEHEATDYIPSISRSPAIPFDANRTPTFGLLKTPGSSTPSAAPARKSLGAQVSRKRALEFF